MKKISFLLFSSLFISKTQAQELFLFIYPASNVPKNTLVLRGMNSFFERTADKSISYHLMPAVEFGLTKKVMLVGNSFLSNENNKFNVEGASILGQYRFYSNDEMKKHFRMSIWSRVAINNAEIHQEEIEINGHNSGVRIGVTGTQLLNKTAISSSISFQKAFDNMSRAFPVNYSTEAIDYTLSIGQLLLPREYKNFKQTNFNLMVEILGQTHTATGKTFVDIAPVAQFIFNSKARIDISYRRQIYSSMLRTQPNGVVLNFQYNFFNIIKPRKQKG